FEEADGGTLLLDEIGELSPSAQAALLRALETKTIRRLGSNREVAVDVRVVAATHRDLEQMCQTGSFRWDLYYRLNTLILRIPSLAERPEDIGPLVERFLGQAARDHHSPVRRVAPEALDRLHR
ncbi:MAG: sigma 54-interacting transcriptional regulator, partial [Anaerolineae bacterium]